MAESVLALVITGGGGLIVKVWPVEVPPSGAGLVTVATPASVLPIVAASMPELMTAVLSGNADGVLDLFPRERAVQFWRLCFDLTLADLESFELRKIRRWVEIGVLLVCKKRH